MFVQFLKSAFAVCLLWSVSATAAPASVAIPYYGDQFFQDLNSGVGNQDLKNELKQILKSYHVANDGVMDKIVSDCAAATGTCYAHNVVGYNGARVFLMGNFYLVNENGSYGVKDVYCDTVRHASEFKHGAPGPNAIPDNTVVNIEHTWPQSRFTGKYPNEMQKSDLHHLFPTDSQLNAIRGNYWFGEVTKDSKNLKCNSARIGTGSLGGQQIFQPPQDHRGHVARALFYFSIRYDLAIDPMEEVVLRKWNRENPVDDEEMRRNNEIYKVQGNRNPFVDYPDLADRIADF
jgi:hypothetical protein